MATLAHSDNGKGDAKFQALQEAARARNIELSIHLVARGEEVAAAMDMVQASRATALNVLASPVLYANRQLIMERVAAMRMPAIYQWPEMAEEGGFAAYGPRITQLPDSLPDWLQIFCAAPSLPICRSSSRRSSS